MQPWADFGWTFFYLILLGWVLKLCELFDEDDEDYNDDEHAITLHLCTALNLHDKIQCEEWILLNG